VDECLVPAHPGNPGLRSVKWLLVVGCCCVYGSTKPRHIPVPVPSQDKLDSCGRKGIPRKNGGLMEADC